MNAQDLATINQLYGEMSVLQSGLTFLDDPDMRIVGFQLGKGPTSPPAALIMTQYMNYPPQMVASIKEQMRARIAEVEAQLSQKGFTIDTPEQSPQRSKR